MPRHNHISRANFVGELISHIRLEEANPGPRAEGSVLSSRSSEVLAALGSTIPAGTVPPGWAGRPKFRFRGFSLCCSLQVIFTESSAATRAFSQTQPGSIFQFSIEKLGCFSNRTRPVSKQIWARLWPVFQEKGDFASKACQKLVFSVLFFSTKPAVSLKLEEGESENPHPGLFERGAAARGARAPQ